MKDLIKRLKELEAKATEGPWEPNDALGEDFTQALGPEIKYNPRDKQSRRIAQDRAITDSGLIAETRNALPKLLDHIEKLEATIAKHERREDSHMKQIDKLEAIAEYAKGFYKATVEWNEGISKIIGHGSSTGIPIGELGRALKEAGKLKVRK